MTIGRGIRMPERIGKIINVNTDHTAEVVTDRTGACSGCQDTQGCRSCLSDSGNKMVSTVLNHAGADPGDVVVIHQKASALWTGAFLLYLLPVFGLIIGAAVGSNLTVRDGVDDSTWAVILGFCGLVLGFLVTFLIARSPGGRERFMPQIIRIIEQGDSSAPSEMTAGTGPNGRAACCEP